MTKLISFFKRIRLAQVLAVFLAGFLTLSSVACSGTTLANASDESAKGIPGHRSESYKGGMNNYSDVDPRMQTTGAAAKAKGLRDNAERNVIDMSDDVGRNTQRTLDKKAENLDQFGRNLKSDANSTADDLSNKADKAARDTQKAVNRAADSVSGDRA